MNNKRIIMLLVGAAMILALESRASAQSQARADLKDGEGMSVGVATLQEDKDGVRVNVQVKGLPAGLHAVHIHAVGKCEGPKFTSAGGHFNPGKKKHGLKSPEGPHGGDLPNMYVTSVGGLYEAATKGVTLKAGEASVFDGDGSALVIHAVADDYTTDPAGNAGDRIACGVITKSAPKKR